MQNLIRHLATTEKSKLRKEKLSKTEHPVSGNISAQTCT